MRTEEPRAIRLQDYRPPDWLVETVDLDVSLDQHATRVRAVLALKPNPDGVAGAPLVLDGDGLEPKSIKLDNALLSPDRYIASPDHLTIPQPPNRPFRLEIETVLDPVANTRLMGLYRSSGTYCTQCEAEGFRRITYFLDRPDVMGVYTTRIEADKDEAPVLLSNGNLVSSGDIAGTNRHFAVWHDPFPKPSYLFALVGGRLGKFEDRFTTMSGRSVALRIYVEPGKEERAAYAMDSLKRSMRWDEEAFGREYDLDIFMIVAVSDFNMGAMENKGLNVFNDKYVLASPQTATDEDYGKIEAIIAHEYFHNWTGNRITCRDWFQLCLKEGLTVFRDQQFTGDQRSHAVERIGDVRVLRAHQFPEDSGPLAHPVRPELYHEISNFYTPTIYEKGAEIIRMLQVMLGRDGFRRGMDLYFARHDGHAATIEQFVACFADATSTDLSHFMRWYHQAGTPQVTAHGAYDAKSRTYRLDLTQNTAPTPGQPVKQPVVIPLVVGLIGPDGHEMPLAANGQPIKDGVLLLEDASVTYEFTGIDARPVLSLNRNFSAPIKLNADLSAEDLHFLAAHDRDAFNRWQALQTVATRLLVGNVEELRAGRKARKDEGLVAAYAALIGDASLDPAYAALCLTLPDEADLAREIGRDVDPDAIYASHSAVSAALASALRKPLLQTYARMADRSAYSPDAASAGRRALKNACLDLLAADGDQAAIALAKQQYDAADNMTDRMAALSTLSFHDLPARRDALDDFYQRFAGDPLVIDKWFALQAMIPEAATLDRVRALTEHKAFSFANPNRVRSLVWTFAQYNQTQFNRADGKGYDFVADIVLALDPKNPQVASRILGTFKSWRMYDAGRRKHAEAALRRIDNTTPLSRDVKDLVTRSLREA